MNSIPKTIKHIGQVSFIGPFAIDQSKIGGNIYNYLYSLEYWELRKKDQSTICSFRVYPKGQNPQSLKRNQ